MTNIFRQALDEMQPVREMTVEEVVKIMWEPCDNYTMSNSAALKIAAQALAKLGTIRIVGDV